MKLSDYLRLFEFLIVLAAFIWLLYITVDCVGMLNQNLTNYGCMSAVEYHALVDSLKETVR